MSRIRLVIYFTVLALSITSTVTAYSKFPVKNRIVYARQLTVENGLSSNFVYSLLRDSKNFTWIGTGNGLNKYDGRSFRHYFRKPFDSSGLQSNVIKALAEDKIGAIWIGTTGAGLEKLDRHTDKFTHFRFNASDVSSIGSDNIRCLFVDSKGRLWIGLENGELDYFDARTQKFWRYLNVAVLNFSFSINPIVSIGEDSKGKLYIGKQNGTVIFDPSTGKCEPIVVLDAASDQYINPPTLTTDPKKNIGLVLSNYQTIYYFPSLSTQLDIARGARINSTFPTDFGWKSLIYQNDSVYWNISSYGVHEINISSPAISSIEIRSLKNDIIHLWHPQAGITAGDGTVWIATENGIIIIELERHPVETYSLPNETESPYSSARSMCIDKRGKLWIGTSSGGIYYLDPSGTTLEEFPIRNYTTVRAFNRMSIDDNNFLWIVGTGSPLLSVNLRNHQLVDFIGDGTLSIAAIAHSLLIDGASHWTGSEEYGAFSGKGALNLLTFSPLTTHSYEYLPHDSTLVVRRIITTIVKRDLTSLWIGTVQGLFIFDIKSGIFTRFAHDPNNANSLSGDNVWVVHRDRNGKLWVGTWNDGLNLFDENKKTFLHYTIEDGLPSNSIRSILEDRNGDLWISTENGISHFDQDKKTFTNFGLSDGLLDLVYEPNSAAISPDGKLFFGGSRGITGFYPGNLQSEYISLPLFITSFRVANNFRFGEIASGSVVHLDYSENDLSFEFAKLDYLDPAQKQYEYKLEGVDKVWINSESSNIARYNNIEPGDYTFRFRVKNDTTGVYASLFIIKPALWMTLWFKLLILLVCVSVTGFLYSRRIKNLKNIQVQLELASENERSGLAGELHDGPLQDLYATRFMLDPFLRMESLTPDATQLDDLLKRVRGDLRTMTGGLQIPRFELGFAEELRLFCESFNERHTAIQVIRNITNETKPLPLRSAQNLFRIFRTAMGNVAKHAYASKVEITFVTTNEIATLKVIDDGIGFDLPKTFAGNSHSKQYGLFMMRNYAASMNGKCSVHSAPRHGTAVEVVIPIEPPLWRKGVLAKIKRFFLSYLFIAFVL